ncbi:MAG TPA: hypothetical protein QF698_04925, partial [Candidatus Marinimicrobia bacterium]|nr:hypothetical protein [Candidatus Neomarinimicrobiota bacterium]
NLGIGGLGASMSIMPLGDIVLDSKLGLGGITGSALLGPVTFSSVTSNMTLGLTGDAQLSGVLSTLKLETSGAAMMQGLLGEVSVSSSGKVKVKGLANSLKEILDEFVDIFLSHTHPTGTGPSGPPMPPASVKGNLLKSIKIGLNLE